MKKTLTIFFFLAAIWLAAPAQDIIVPKRSATAGSGGGSSASDDFNRADGGLGGNWTQMWSFASLGVTSNKAGTDGAAFWSGAGSFGDNYHSETIIDTQNNSAFNGTGVRMSGTSFGTAKGYFCGTNTNSPANRIKLFMMNADSTITDLVNSLSAPNISNGDVIKLTVTFSGGVNTLTCAQNGSNIGVLTGITDSTLGGGGKPGFVVGTAVDNWSAGTP